MSQKVNMFDRLWNGKYEADFQENEILVPVHTYPDIFEFIRINNYPRPHEERFRKYPRPHEVAANVKFCCSSFDKRKHKQNALV